MHTVEDASRKLAVMDSQGRVWAQEMLLRVSPDRVTLLDPVSKVPGGTWVGKVEGPSLQRHGKLAPGASGSECESGLPHVLPLGTGVQGPAPFLAIPIKWGCYP